MPFEILAKKGGAGEIQGVGNLLDGHVCGFQFGFDVHHHYMGYDVQYVFSAFPSVSMSTSRGSVASATVNLIIDGNVTIKGVGD